MPMEEHEVRVEEQEVPVQDQEDPVRKDKDSEEPTERESENGNNMVSFDN